MTTIIPARPLEVDGFAPFGTVTTRPAATDGTAVAGLGAAANLRPGVATARLAWFAVPGSRLPLRVVQMERHRFSSQSFVPCGPVDWLVLVAPEGADGGPDMARARAFIAGADQAITLHPDVWHHPLTALGPASFAVVTCLADEADDEEFRPLSGPWTVVREASPSG